MKSYLYLTCLFLISACSKAPQTENSKEKNPHYDRAYDFVDLGQTDSAFFYFNKAREFFSTNRDSIGVSMALVNMAICQEERGDLFGGQESALQALSFLDGSKKEHVKNLSYVFNILGNVTDKLKDYKRASDFYRSAIKYSDDPGNTVTYKNNLAVTYQHNKQYVEAIPIFEEILKLADPGSVGYARTLTNLANTKWLMNKSYNPIRAYHQALTIRFEKNDVSGLNSSYGHLVDYYENVNADSAIFYAKRRYLVAKAMDNPDEKIKALLKLIVLSPDHEAKRYFTTYRQLRDSVHDLRNSAKNQFALIRYDVEKSREAQIRLEQQNAENDLYLAWQQFFIVVLMVLAIGGAYWFYKHRQQLLIEATARLKASQLKTSRKVHDVVANGLYRVMSEIEHTEEINREEILDRLEDMYHKSRDISYEEETQTKKVPFFHVQISDLLKSFANERRKILIAGNDPDVWEPISKPVKQEILQVMQELMVNMKKHSEADHVVIRFENEGDSFSIFYADNGIGIKDEINFGNGLRNTVSRIESISGNVKFVNDLEKGLKIEIQFPVHQKIKTYV